MGNLYAGQEQQLELDLEQQTSSKSGKDYYSNYLTEVCNTDYPA